MMSVAIFAAAPATPASAPASSATGVLIVCHGHGRLAQSELLGVELQHSDPVVTERSERSRCAAELRRQRDRDRREAGPGLHETDEPTGRLEPERRRHRLLQQRACGHHCVPVLSRDARAFVRCAGELVVHELRRALRHQHGGRVDDVLARRAEMDGARMGLADPRPQRANERLGRVSGGAALHCELGDVVQRRITCVGDRSGSLLGEDAGPALRAGERALGVEHRAQP